MRTLSTSIVKRYYRSQHAECSTHPSPFISLAHDDDAARRNWGDDRDDDAEGGRFAGRGDSGKEKERQPQHHGSMLLGRRCALALALGAFALLTGFYRGSTSREARDSRGARRVSLSDRTDKGEGGTHARSESPPKQQDVIRKTGVVYYARPQGWEGYTMKQIRGHFKCDVRQHDEDKSATASGEWRLLQGQYTRHVNPDRRWEDPIPPTEGYALKSTGKPAPFYAKHSDGKGRGLFASRDIQKGEVVHDGTMDVSFPDAASYRRFIFSLPRHLACDVAYWNWTCHDGEGKLVHYLNLSIGSYENSGAVNDVNVALDSPTGSEMRALRDIRKDEELLENYGECVTNWHGVGL